MNAKNSFSAYLAQGCPPHSTILEALRFAREFLAQSCLGEGVRVKASVIIEELISNSLQYGGAHKDISLCLTLVEQNGALIVKLEDDGPAFDPSDDSNFCGPDPETGGGVGLAVVRNWANEMTYNRSENLNVLQLLLL